MKEKLQFPQAVRRIFCVLLALVMLVTVVAQPQETYAASKNPYYIRINRQQNCVTIYKLDKKGKYTIPVKAMACCFVLFEKENRGLQKSDIIVFLNTSVCVGVRSEI